MTEKENYIVLARKYRPKKLSDIIGQDEICKVIEGSVKLGRVAHAFLFSGTRGVGKTTLARILSKIVNCSNLQKEIVEPCGECNNCKSIDLDNNIDVVEIDAASRTGVSDVREIIENVNYKPVSAKKKIFIIDEVHMLSKAAFNALLKTLEEPPTDVVFIFATTETEKIPLTILSRCQRFQLKRVDVELISKFLINISEKEGFTIEAEGCDLIAQASEGSVRDALSILDNVLTRGNPVKTNVIRGVLGLSDNSLTLKLYKFLFEGDVKKSLEIFNDLYIKGISINLLSQTLMKLTYHAIRIKVGVDINSTIIDNKSLDVVKYVSKSFEIDFLIRFWELMKKYMDEINRYFDEKQCFEMIIMRLCYVSLIPTPFDLLKKSNLNEVNNDEKEKKDSLEVEKKTQKKESYNLSQNFESKRENILRRFKFLVDQIEKQSEMVISYHLKNSYKLVSLTESRTIKEIELQNISDNQDSKKILWKASKLLDQITKKRWIISLTQKEGIQTIIDYEQNLEKKKIDEIKKDIFVKKILEIIPSSEITSIREIDELKLKKKEGQNE